jgi:hypothetical protein
VRERDRRTYTLIWVAITVVAAGILVWVGSLWFAAALVAVLLAGLVAFLRVTHPRGAGKPNINIFFDDLEGLDEVETDEGAEPPAPPAPATRPPAARPAPAPPASAPAPRADADADVIDLRPSARREVPAPGTTLSDAVAASDEAAVSVSGGDVGTGSPEVAEELSAHHVRLLRKVQTHLREYE